MTASQQPLKVFLCHASQDKPKVRELYRYLKEQGIQPWFDEEDLIPGQNWHLEITKALAASDAIMICLTKNSVDKEGYVQREIKFALDRALEMPEGRIFLIPVRFELCEVPYSLSPYQWVDLFDPKGYSKITKALQLRASQVNRSMDVSPLPLTVPAGGLEAEKVQTPPYASKSISLVQSFPAPGRMAEGIAWDGKHLWLTDNSASIFELDPTGTLCDVYQSPEGTPQGITWDGSAFWVYTTNRSLIYRLQLSGGKREILSSFEAPTEAIGGGVTQDLAWDGNSLWYANQYKLYRIEPSGKGLSYLPFANNIMGVAWDGSNLWLAYKESEKSTLIVVDTTGKTLVSYLSPIFEIDGLAWADGYLWALGIDSPGGPRMVYKLQVNQ
jgi:hypothetical protein